MAIPNLVKLLTPHVWTGPIALRVPAPDFGLLTRWMDHQKHLFELARLARHHPRLLEDAGLDPEEVRAALKGTWHEVGTHQRPHDGL
ncbi:hypothetical protein [Pelagibacterium halotolerans]|uniref:Uncharacterized protein n=1 Tax=Pelagibacterium halotolerans (strain DSM 22347 / JCM 15775 / CGMCC 1.7692 / B2) TaxID=1082931 RepID=G4R6D6_PELHB|nr:hypothetical protein [Pelagibacterium halotolerans]AEQ53201.1 hypothetical protein KKY_3212 [Pelagibacterium halotolerans B2]QJR17161.1 hypothetical protein HKM20_01010 [Pelagibacterium halotolerans]SEA89966.1 hypothetical protein SAMN05428936_11182 [Pelagibacterium halotolerans]